MSNSAKPVEAERNWKMATAAAGPLPPSALFLRIMNPDRVAPGVCRVCALLKLSPDPSVAGRARLDVCTFSFACSPGGMAGPACVG